MQDATVEPPEEIEEEQPSEEPFEKDVPSEEPFEKGPEPEETEYLEK